MSYAKADPQFSYYTIPPKPTADHGPKQIPSEPTKPHMGVSHEHRPQRHQNPYADRRSHHAEYSPFPLEYKKRQPTPEVQPFSQDKIKIPYSTYQRAGPHNERRPANHTSDAHDPYTREQMAQLKADHAALRAERQSRPSRGRSPTRHAGSSEDDSRKRSGSLTRFKNWLERKLTGSESGRVAHPPASASSSARPSTANSQASSKTSSSKFGSHDSKNSTDASSIATGNSSHSAKKSKTAQTTGQVNVQRLQEPQPAYVYGSDNRNTTWSNFVNPVHHKAPRTNTGNPPPIPSRPTDYVPTPLPGNPNAFSASTTDLTSKVPARKPVPSAHPPAKPLPSSTQVSTHPTANLAPTTKHSKKPSLLQQVSHGLHRRDSNDSDFSFACAGIDDEAYKPSSRKRQEIISRTAEKRQAARDSDDSAKMDTVFNEAQRKYAKDADERLEKRIRDSIARERAETPRCVVCDVEKPMAEKDVCVLCFDKYPGLVEKYTSVVIDQDISSLTGPFRPQSTSDTDVKVDLTSYTGPFARPPSSIYPTARPDSGYTSGNPYSEDREKVLPPIPPMPPLPDLCNLPQLDKKPVGYKGRMGLSRPNVTAGTTGEQRNTRFYDQINEVHRMYDTGSAPQTPAVNKQWRSARKSGKY
ncbi:MAG: hypothetical protein Q9162_000708 [Coniocarpon cinnabarinum]